MKKVRTLRRMQEVLSDTDHSKRLGHLSAADRAAALEILAEQLLLLDFWQSKVGG
jgi:hypothetical protein